jgi:hypothetical protein
LDIQTIFSILLFLLQFFIYKSAAIDMRLLYVITITSFGSVSGYICLVNSYSKEIKNDLRNINSERR